MPELDTNQIVEALLESLETMAFMSLAPAGSDQPPEAVRKVSIDFTHPVAGRIELMAPAALGHLLCANIMGIDPSEPDAQAGGDDALRELMNVTCGSLLSGHFPGTEAEMGLPALEPADGPEAWRAFLEEQDIQVLDADGHTIALRLAGGRA